MSDSLIHLQTAPVPIIVIIKTRPFAEIVYWGPAFKPLFAAGLPTA
ncbi:hypothetical protein ACFIOX_25925 [Klebsiella pneumoniae]